LLDDDICIREAHDKRRQRPRYLVRCIPDRADIGSRYQAGSRDAKTVRRSMEVIDFSSGRASEILREVFAKAITQRWEGFVLKGCDDLYFSFQSTNRFIKMKRDYSQSLGDAADFADGVTRKTSRRFVGRSASGHLGAKEPGSCELILPRIDSTLRVQCHSIRRSSYRIF
jgi:hypothetical protein